MKSIDHFPVFILLIFFQSAFSKSVQDYSGIVINAQTNNPIEAGAKLNAEPKEKPWSQIVSNVRDLDGFLIEICTLVI